MKSIYITIFCCITLISNSFSQQPQQSQQNLSDSEKKQIERYEEESKRKKLKYINEFMATIEVDEFQKEIITQAMDSYFDELLKLSKLNIKSYEVQTHIAALDHEHFKDVRAIVDEETMSKIMNAIKGKWDQKEEKKKKKRNRKNKN